MSVVGQNLIPNNEFEAGDFGSWPNSQGNCDNPSQNINNFISNWKRALNAYRLPCDHSSCPSPDWFQAESCIDEGIAYPEINGNKWIHAVTDGQGSDKDQEGVRVKLVEQLQSGESYTLSYWVLTQGGVDEGDHDFRVYLCNHGHFWDIQPFWAWGRNRILIDVFRQNILSHGISQAEIIPSPYQPVAKHWHQRRSEFVVPSDMDDLEHLILISRDRTHHFDAPILSLGGCEDPLIIDNTTFRPGVHHPYYGTPIQIGYNGSVTSEGATLTFVSPVEVQINEVHVPGNEAFHVYNAPCHCETPIVNTGSAEIVCEGTLSEIEFGSLPQEWMEYSWSCEPSYGMGYLSSATVSNPIFTSPMSDNHQLTYTLTVTNTCGESLSEELPVIVVNSPDNTPNLIAANFMIDEWPLQVWVYPDEWIGNITVEWYNYGSTEPVQQWDLIAFQDFTPGEDFFWEFPDGMPICDGYTAKVRARNICSSEDGAEAVYTKEPHSGPGVIHELSNVFWPEASEPHNSITLIHSGFTAYSLQVYDNFGMLIHSVSNEPINSNLQIIWNESMHNESAWSANPGSTMYIILTLNDCEGGNTVITDYWTILGGTGPYGRLANPDLFEQFEMSWGRTFQLDEEDDLLNTRVAVLPNPNDGAFTVTGEDLHGIQILEVSGKLVKELKEPLNNRIQVNGLGAGLFIVRIHTQDGSVVNRRIVVQR